MASKKFNLPVPVRLSSWNNMTEIIYQCPKCAQSFALLRYKESYCHNCGAKISWENSPIYCGEKFSALYFNADSDTTLSFWDRESKKLNLLNYFVDKYRAKAEVKQDV